MLKFVCLFLCFCQIQSYPGPNLFNEIVDYMNSLDQLNTISLRGIGNAQNQLEKGSENEPAVVRRDRNSVMVLQHQNKGNGVVMSWHELFKAHNPPAFSPWG